jgi:hypothetical protein
MKSVEFEINLPVYSIFHEWKVKGHKITIIASKMKSSIGDNNWSIKIFPDAFLRFIIESKKQILIHSLPFQDIPILVEKEDFFECTFCIFEIGIKDNLVISRFMLFYS